MTTTRREFLYISAIAGATAALGAAAAPEKRGAGAPAKGKRILILGGTAFLGPHIVENARGRGHALTLFNRGKTNPGLFPDVETLIGDRKGNLKALEGRTWDAVVDTSGYTPKDV